MKTAHFKKYVKDLCNLLFENCIVSLSYVNKVWFITDISKSYFFVHHKNYGSIEIVDIFTIAMLKYLSGGEMST